nr:MAG TPA: Skeletal muscle LIM-protein 1 domain, Skeletal muscle LIM-protein [Caudoviricetes sp.]
MTEFYISLLMPRCRDCRESIFGAQRIVLHD